MFRIGTTSYIIPADILPNVEFLAPLVDDIQLILFEIDEYGSNLPDAGQVARLAALAKQHGVTYTVHLPLDLHLAEPGNELDISLRKARRVIDATLPLGPYAYTVHLDGRSLAANPSSQELAGWQHNAQAALELVLPWLPDPTRLCVENLEAWDPEAFAPIVDALPISRTVDVGHLWLTHTDPIPMLDRWLPRTRVIHLHGVAERDHVSLVHTPVDALAAVVGLLADRFDGVVTLEVFSLDDFQTSLAAVNAALGALGKR